MKREGNDEADIRDEKWIKLFQTIGRHPPSLSQQRNKSFVIRAEAKVVAASLVGARHFPEAAAVEKLFCR